jgi:hypothetical protein
LEANQGQANAGILFLSPSSGSSIAVTGIDAQYTVDSSGILTLNLLLAPGADLNAVQFSIPQASSISTSSNGALTAKFGFSYIAPTLVFQAPLASQTGPSGQLSRSASFTVQSATSFGLLVEALDSTLPLQIAFQLNAVPYTALPYVAGSSQHAVDAAGDVYYVTLVADVAGKAPAFPALSGVGCGLVIDTPVPCTDAAIYKYSAAGTLQFITYLEGGVNETPGFLGLNPDGKVAVAGTTDSSDFPVTDGAFQTSYAGPPPVASQEPSYPGGDFFAAVLDPATGRLQSATFFGSPNPGTLGTAAIGTDGSLYFLPASAVDFSVGLPLSSGALLSACQSSQNVTCYNGYAARLSPALDNLIYGTYLPGMSQATAQLYSDGSVYYAGTAQAGFPVTPGAYRRRIRAATTASPRASIPPVASSSLLRTSKGQKQTGFSGLPWLPMAACGQT